MYSVKLCGSYLCSKLIMIDRDEPTTCKIPYSTQKQARALNALLINHALLENKPQYMLAFIGFPCQHCMYCTTSNIPLATVQDTFLGAIIQNTGLQDMACTYIDLNIPTLQTLYLFGQCKNQLLSLQTLQETLKWNTIKPKL